MAPRPDRLDGIAAAACCVSALGLQCCCRPRGGSGLTVRPRRYLASTWGLYKALACCARRVCRATAWESRVASVASVLQCARHVFFSGLRAHTSAYSSVVQRLFVSSRPLSSAAKETAAARLHKHACLPQQPHNHVRRAGRLRRDGAAAATTTGQRRRRVVAARGPVLPLLLPTRQIVRLVQSRRSPHENTRFKSIDGVARPRCLYRTFWRRPFFRIRRAL